MGFIQQKRGKKIQEKKKKIKFRKIRRNVHITGERLFCGRHLMCAILTYFNLYIKYTTYNRIRRVIIKNFGTR